MQKKIVLTIFVTALFAFSLFTMTDTDDSTAALTAGEFFVNNVDVLAQSGDLPSGCTFNDGDTLILNNVELTQCYEGGANSYSPIYFEPSSFPRLVIVLEGDNVINVDASGYGADAWSGIFSSKDLIIKGSGTLTINDNNSNMYRGIEVCGSLTIIGGTYDINGQGASTVDIYAGDNININKGAVNVSKCIHSTGVSVSGGAITFTGKHDTASNIFCDGGTFQLSGSGLINFNYELAVDDELIHSGLTPIMGEATMSSNLAIDGNDVKATAAGNGWIKSSSFYVNDTPITGDDSGEGWTYTASTHTLVLNNATLTATHAGSGYSSPIYFDNRDATLNIILAPSSVNSIEYVGSANNCGIYSSGGLKISGSGSLTIGDGYDYGINVEENNLQIDGGTINIGNCSSNAIDVGYSFPVTSDAGIVMTGGNLNLYDTDNPIYVMSNVGMSMEGGTLSIKENMIFCESRDDFQPKFTLSGGLIETNTPNDTCIVKVYYVRGYVPAIVLSEDALKYNIEFDGDADYGYIKRSADGYTFFGYKASTVTFDANGGICDTEFAKTGTDGKLLSLPTATHSEYALLGWYTLAEGGDQISTDYIFYIDTTVYAHWGIAHKVTYVTDGGSAPGPTQADVAEGGTFSVASYDGTKEGFIFGGWNDGTKVYAAGETYTVGTSDVTLTAVWNALPTVTFDANGGICDTESAKTGTDGKLASLPDATREGYTFDGWFTEATGGTQITTSTVFDSNTTVYAHWKSSGGGGGEGGDWVNFIKENKFVLSIISVIVVETLVIALMAWFFSRRK